MTLPVYRHRGLVFRAHNPKWAFAPASGRGAGLYGGRFNPPGLDTLYTAEHPETAWLEAQQGLPFKPQPLTLCAYEVDCTDVVELSDADARAAAGTSLADLGCAWEDLADRGHRPPSWRLADDLRRRGCAGVRVPSFAPGARQRDVNLVFWDWADASPHKVTVIDDEGRLPRDPSSWT